MVIGLFKLFGYLLVFPFKLFKPIFVSAVFKIGTWAVINESIDFAKLYFAKLTYMHTYMVHGYLFDLPTHWEIRE